MKLVKRVQLTMGLFGWGIQQSERETIELILVFI